jgi:adenylate cyclase
MAWEIERKFLVRDDAWRSQEAGVHCRQGYLSLDPERSVRVRVAGGRGTLTIKGLGLKEGRPEFEYEIPLPEAEALLDGLCIVPLIVKTRYRVPYQGLVWEVDVFAGENEGLVLAEVELEKSGREVGLPPWAGEEVTGDPRYFNAALVTHPFSRWKEA